MAEITADSEDTIGLLQQIREGRPAFDELFARHRSTLKAAVELRMDAALRARIDASDIVQEAHADAFRRLEDYLRRQPMPFHLWLRKTAQERLIMARRFHLNASRRAVRRELPLPNRSTILLGRELLASGKSPSETIGAEELAARVKAAVAELPDTDREILLMRNYEGLSYKEIACILEIESATARQRNGRALVRLHKLLSDQGITESKL